MMIDLKKHMVSEDASIIEAMSAIDKNAKGIIFVSSGSGNVIIGSLTDGDIRRHIINNGALTEKVKNVCNRNFISVYSGQSEKEIEDFMKKRHLLCVPELNSEGCLVNVHFLQNSIKTLKEQLKIPVIITAGGKGTRLYPYTKILPKPLISIGESTITEHICKSFLPYGCDKFIIIVNHRKNLIKAYFEEENLNYKINFVDEDKPMGTGGGLSLLNGRINETFFMTNCDILVFEDYAKILEYHKTNGNLITLVCATKNIEIPYGVIKIKEHGQIVKLQEKPNFSFLTNTGLYVIEPEFLKYIPQNTYINITDVIQNCIDEGMKIGMFPISDDKWSDMGQIEEMEKMKLKLTQV